ncbi:hypothetical protein Btru_015554 [Bulinus truncatus]|nr:hypothetical protein Btru_015554 [Bulinus truncatus]
MSSNGSRKRRHKSKDKTLAFNQSSDDTPLSRMSEQQTKQESELPRLQQDSLQSTAQQESEPPDREPGGKQQEQDNDQQLVLSKPVPPLSSLLDRFFFSRRSDMSRQGNVNVQGTVSWRHHDIAEMLLQKGEDLAELFGSAQNSLMVAASSGDVKMLNILWAFKGNVLDINATDKDGNTALHLCTQTSCKEGVSFLMSCGADVNAKNKRGQTPLHIAAKQGDPDVCDAFIKSLPQVQSPESEQQVTVKGILKEDMAGRTPICEALRFQHLMVVKTLMNSCDQDEALDFYVRRIQRLKSLPTGSASDSDQDIQSIMGSLLLVIKRLQKDHLKELADADPINCLVDVIRLHVESIRVLSTACLMISQLIWKEYPEEGNDPMKVQGQEDDARNRDVRDELLKQFLDCRGPHMVMEKLSSHVFTAHDTYLIVSTLLPVMILASRAAGKTWLEKNSGNLSFFKELLTRKKTFITHINLRNQVGHGLQLGHLIKEFSSFVEGIEAKDREQNLVELLEEEERERIKREKKKRKRQKKQNKQNKAEAPQVTIPEVSTDDETVTPPVAWNSEAYRKCAEISTSRSLENNPARSLFHSQQEAQAAPSLRNSHAKELEVASKQLFTSHSAETNSEKETKWAQSVTAAEEFPPISAASDDRVTTDVSEGWVKVEGRKPGGRNAVKPMSSCLVNPNPVKTQELAKLAPMRWADVAKIGCSKDPTTRNFTVLLGDVGKSGSQEYFKLSSLSKSTEASASVISQSSESEEIKRRIEERNSDWQQIARNAFVDNMSSKERDTDHAHPTDVSSDSDSEDMSSTTSSECPSGLSSDLKNSISMAEDFSGIDTSFSKTACKNREFPSIACAFSNFYSEPKEHKLFPSDDVGSFDFHRRSFIGQKILADSTTVSDKNHHRNDEKRQDGGLLWNWLDEKLPASLLLQNDWETGATAARSLDISSLTTCSESKQHFQRQEVEADIQSLSLLSRLSSPPFSTRDLFSDILPEFGINSSSLYPQQANQDRSEKAAKMSFEFPFQKKMFIDQQLTMKAWQSSQFLPSEMDRSQWTEKEGDCVKPLTLGKVSAAWSSLLHGDGVTSSVSPQQAPESFMPSFASMSNAVDNNPIVTSVVESVLTSTVTPLSSSCTETKLPTFCSSKNDVPSPPPGFQLRKPNPLRAFALDQSLCLLNTQSVFSKPIAASSTVSDLTGKDFGLSSITSSSGHCEYDARPVDKSLTYSTSRSRSPMVGVVGPFTKVTEASDDSLTLQQQNRQHRQLVQTSTGSMFVASSTAPSFSSVVSSCMASSVPRSSIAQSVFGLPVNASQKIPATTALTSWSERVAQSLNQTATSSLLNSPASPTVSSLLDFTSILAGRPQVRSTSRLLDSQSSLFKRTADNQLRSLQDVMETYQRRQAEQLLLQQQLHERQLHQHCYGINGSHLSQLYRQQKSGLGLQQQQLKSTLNTILLQQRQNQHRLLQQQLSPPVLFPSDLRDEPDTTVGDKQQTFPAFHDTGSSDLLSDLFADPLLIERIAINQIRQQFQTQQANCLLRESAMSALRDSVYANDLEYYASMYRVKLKDILGGSPWHTDSGGRVREKHKKEWSQILTCLEDLADNVTSKMEPDIDMLRRLADNVTSKMVPDIDMFRRPLIMSQVKWSQILTCSED